MVKRVIH